MSNVLVVTYSYTGISRRLAQLLCEQQQWPLTEIRELRPRSGAWGTWRCILDSVFRRQPPVRLEGAPPEDFDAVVLVAPVWLSRLAGPMRSFVAWNRRSLRNVAVISVQGSSGSSSNVAEITRLIGRAPLLSTVFGSREVEEGQGAARLRAFGNALSIGLQPAAPVRPAVLSPQDA